VAEAGAGGPSTPLGANKLLPYGLPHPGEPAAGAGYALPAESPGESTQTDESAVVHPRQDAVNVSFRLDAHQVDHVVPEQKLHLPDAQTHMP
jgi:hypothetical protein